MTVAACRPLVREDGFTLLELVVALTLLALLLPLLFGGLHFGTAVWQRVDDRGRSGGDAEAVQTVLRRLIAQASPTPVMVEAGRTAVSFDGDREGVTFLAPLPAAADVQGFGRISLHSADAKGAKRLVMTWTPELAAGAPHDEVLLDGLAEIRFAYFGPDGDEPSGPPSWQEEWRRRPALPRLVRLHVRFADGRGRSWPDLVAAPMMDRDAGCLFDPVTRDCRGR